MQATQTAVLQAHQAAVDAALAAKKGTYKPAEAAAAIAAAAGPDHAAVAASETQILDASYAAYAVHETHDAPAHAEAGTRTEIPYGFLSLVGICLVLIVVADRRAKVEARRTWRTAALVVGLPALLWLGLLILQATGVLSGVWLALAGLVGLLVALFLVLVGLCALYGLVVTSVPKVPFWKLRNFNALQPARPITF